MKNISKMPMMAWGCVGTWPVPSETAKIMTKPAIASNAAVIWGVKEEDEKEEWGKIKDTGYTSQYFYYTNELHIPDRQPLLEVYECMVA